jgi:hypothetical protein
VPDRVHRAGLPRSASRVKEKRDRSRDGPAASRLRGIDPNRHPGEGLDFNLASEMDGETPAFAGVTMKG